MTKLFYVELRAHEFHNCKDVPLTFFNWEPGQHQRSYAELIEGYDPQIYGIGYTEDFINELFTEDEAKQLKAYLDQDICTDGDVTTIREVELPAPNNTGGLGAQPVGGSSDFLMFFKRPDYPLPFKAAAYFDLHSGQPIEREQQAAPLECDGDMPADFPF
jgi:hypothetical protein